MLDDSKNAATVAAAPLTARNWTKVLAAYREPDLSRSIFEVATTALPFVALWILAWAALDYSYWLSLLIAIPAAGFLVRLFLIQHDCGHGAFFRHRAANDWMGRILGVLTFTPYDLWRRSHATHHATTGNLDYRGIGDIATLTVSEYRSQSLWGRLKYRVYRHPVIMFVIGPAHLFLLQHRWPVGFMRNGWLPWVSTMATNAAIAALLCLLIWLVGLKAVLFVHLPIMLLAASAGVWLFYVQHQFGETVWERESDWNLHHAALHGSSHYDLHPILHWFTANIGMHHLHHLCSRIPFYRLPHVLSDHPELKGVSRLTLGESLRCVQLALWDENQRRLVSFRDAQLQPV